MTADAEQKVELPVEVRARLGLHRVILAIRIPLIVGEEAILLRRQHTAAEKTRGSFSQVAGIREPLRARAARRFGSRPGTGGILRRGDHARSHVHQVILLRHAFVVADRAAKTDAQVIEVVVEAE